MVSTRQTTTKTTSKKSTKAQRSKPELHELPEFDIDDDLCSAEHDQLRPLNFPYGNIINDRPAGIMIPVEQLEKANWYNIPDEDDLDIASIGDAELQGLLLTEARMRILAVSPEYIRYKNDDDLGDLSKTLVGLYEDYRNVLDKKQMDVCSDHLLLFVDANSQPLHEIPIVVRFRNVALWSFREVREKWGRALEQSVFKRTQKAISKRSKSDRWRANGILEVVFKAESEGEGKNKSLCCKTVSYVKPTVENIHTLYTGSGELRQIVTELLETAIGFADVAVSLPALPGEAANTAIEVLPLEAKSKKAKSRKPLKSAAVDAEDEFLDEDDGDFDESDDDLDELDDD